MAHGEETFHFTYRIGEHKGKGSVEFIAKPTAKYPTEEGWKAALFNAICYQIAKQETDYVLKTPHAKIGDRKLRTGKLEYVADLEVSIANVVHSYNSENYTVLRQPRAQLDGFDAYYRNLNENDGKNVLHRVGCKNFPQVCILFGSYASFEQALEEAQQILPTVAGCGLCCAN